MLKKTIYLTAILGLALVMAGPVLAQTSNSKSTDNTNKAMVSSKLEAGAAERVSNYVKVMLNRFDAAIARTDNLASRIASRLQVMDSSDKAVAKNRKSLDEAKTKIAASRTKFDTAKATLEGIATSDDPAAALATSRTEIDDLKSTLNAIYTTLGNIVDSIKGTATTTATSTPASQK